MSIVDSVLYQHLREAVVRPSKATKAQAVDALVLWVSSGILTIGTHGLKQCVMKLSPLKNIKSMA